MKEVNITAIAVGVDAENLNTQYWDKSSLSGFLEMPT